VQASSKVEFESCPIRGTSQTVSLLFRTESSARMLLAQGQEQAPQSIRSRSSGERIAYFGHSRRIPWWCEICLLDV
jgi:hypothetical protein